MNEPLPFIAVPSAVDIMHYFVEQTNWRNDGGTNLWREGGDYCYLWVEAHVDHDIEQYFLLDIRTNVNDNESRTYLWVAFNIFSLASLECEWHMDTVSYFGASYETHMNRFRSGMNWFTNNIMARREAASDTVSEAEGQEASNE